MSTGGGIDERAGGDMSGLPAAERRVTAGVSARRPHIVVGVQGDDASVAALRWAARSARARGAVLEALMAWELPELPPHPPGGVQEAAEAVIADLQWALESIVDRSGIGSAPGVSVLTTVTTGSAKAALAEAAERADLIVLGAVHHATAVAALSVGRHAAASSRCPVALVPVSAGTMADSSVAGRIVVGVDGSPQADAALRWACQEAALRRVPVRAVAAALSSEALKGAAAAVTAVVSEFPSLDIRLVTPSGDPAEVLAAEAVGSEALVLGQHGGNTIRRRLPSLGSVSRWCAAHPVSPVVIVPLPTPPHVPAQQTGR